MAKKYSWIKGESLTQFANRNIPVNPTAEDVIDVLKAVESKVCSWAGQLTITRKQEIVEFCAYATARHLLIDFEQDIYKAFPAPPMFLVLGEKILKEMAVTNLQDDMVQAMDREAMQEAELLFNTIQCIHGDKIVSFADLNKKHCFIEVTEAMPTHIQTIAEEEIKFCCYKLLQYGGTLLMQVKESDDKAKMFGFLSPSKTWEPISKDLLQDVMENAPKPDVYPKNIQYMEVQRFIL